MYLAHQFVDYPVAPPVMARPFPFAPLRAFEPTPETKIQYHFKPTTIVTEHGCGFASDSEQISSLQMAAINFARESAERCDDPIFIELGAGTGRATVNMAEAGVRVIAYDRENNFSEEAFAMQKRGGAFLFQKPIEELTHEHLPRRITGALAERFFHWLPYNDANRVIRLVASRMQYGDKIFMSVASFDCEKLKRLYPCTPATPLKERHKPSNGGVGELGAPVTLYTFGEAKKLLTDNGFHMESLRQTDWGLWTAVGTRTKASLFAHQRQPKPWHR